mgnify:CR=1 FL=1
MKKGIITSATIIIAAILSGCAPDEHMRAFAQSDEMRIQVGRDVPFRYDPLCCQMSYNRASNEFRAFTDNMSDFYLVRMDSTPSSEGEQLKADIIWTTATDILTRKNLTLKVIKAEGEEFWLWSDSGRIGVSVTILE